MIPGDEGTELANAGEDSIASARTSLEYIILADEHNNTNVVDDIIASLMQGQKIEDPESIVAIRGQGLWDDNVRGLSDEARAVLGGFLNKDDDGTPYFEIEEKVDDVPVYEAEDLGL